jgi:hypothetical protein
METVRESAEDSLRIDELNLSVLKEVSFFYFNKLALFVNCYFSLKNIVIAIRLG